MRISSGVHLSVKRLIVDELSDAPLARFELSHHAVLGASSHTFAETTTGQTCGTGLGPISERLNISAAWPKS